MATAAVLSPHDVPTTLNYYAPTDDSSEPPYSYLHTPPAGKPRTNVGQDPRPVVVHDVRGREHELTLDTVGFQFMTAPSAETAFDDEARIKTEYYREVEQLLKTVTGAKRVFIFDHTIRRPEDAGEGTLENQIRGPAELVHVDQTYAASIARVRYHLPADADRLLQGRVRLINVWRPIAHPVAHHPLAVSDWRTLDAHADLVPMRFIYPEREGGAYSVRYHPRHEWYYLADQTPEEVTLIKCYDSEEGVARLTPHTAFPDKTALEGAPHVDRGPRAGV
ncbi:uncharacterized protein TRAVEDRAFT_71487 [Trametes versicolor FP-101664 SS1]|uniref:uncharacterized protein n=1 Tax=Trametes versicolor (strain FP-101664) TaxID=717944 RepID=UPI0004621708|nr:uncharacterized protein TRAVEDRAFT_71487 [Trametes versicolor FP-101664 SS1]EIW59405.1 hypothetical protein TRAVEDRAFT_71487 [Trametes versicolor FP-101664 SS1]